LLLSTGAAAQTAAGQDWYGGFLLAGQQQNGLAATPLNQQNFLGIASHTSELAALLEGSYQGVSWRTRLDEQWSEVPGQDGHPRQGSARLQELNKLLPLGQDVTLSLGKRLYSLDPAYFNQPLGFFQKRTDLGDPLDSLGQSEGLPMAVLSWTGAKASAAALYSRDAKNAADGYNRGVEQALLKLGYEFGTLSANAILRRASGETQGKGGSISGAWGNTLAYYASYYSAQGTQRPILDSLLPGYVPGPGQFPVLGFFRSNDGQRYQRASLGLVLTPEHLPKLQLEYSYDGRGLSDAQYASLLAQMQANSASQNPALPLIVQQARQATLAQLFIPQGLRRRYVSAMLATEGEQWNASAGLYWGVEDSGKVWYANAEYKLNPRLSLLFSGMLQQGPADSERSLSPVSSSLAARARLAF
jgi:hypothetical protein